VDQILIPRGPLTRPTRDFLPPRPLAFGLSTPSHLPTRAFIRVYGYAGRGFSIILPLDDSNATRLLTLIRRGNALSRHPSTILLFWDAGTCHICTLRCWRIRFNSSDSACLVFASCWGGARRLTLPASTWVLGVYSRAAAVSRYSPVLVGVFHWFYRLETRRLQLYQRLRTHSRQGRLFKERCLNVLAYFSAGLPLLR